MGGPTGRPFVVSGQAGVLIERERHGRHGRVSKSRRTADPCCRWAILLSMRLHRGMRTIALALAVGFALTACSGGKTSSTKPPSAPSKTPSVLPLAWPWKGAEVCPSTQQQLRDKGMQWVVSADNTGRECIIISQAASEQKAQGLVYLRAGGGSGTCPSKAPPAGITARQVSNLGSSACEVSGRVPISRGGGVFVEIGVRFNDTRGVGISCQSTTTKSVAALQGTCRSVVDAVISALREH